MRAAQSNRFDCVSDAAKCVSREAALYSFDLKLIIFILAAAVGSIYINPAFAADVVLVHVDSEWVNRADQKIIGTTIFAGKFTGFTCQMT
jgi:hypothetical protein